MPHSQLQTQDILKKMQATITKKLQSKEHKSLVYSIN